MEGYVTLKDAAKIIGRSTARTRQYVQSGQLEWVRDEMGHIHVSELSLKEFTPPERGEARARGVNPATQLRHVKAARKLVKELVGDGPAKDATVQVLNKLAGALAEKVSEAEAANAENDDEDTEDTVVIEDAPEAASVEMAAEQPANLDDLIKKL